MTQATFVYAPNSGPRWIGGAGPREGATVPSVVWPNKSAHVLGNALAFESADPFSYWRHEAQSAAEAIAMACGGIAWDDCGTINIVVPPWLQQAAMRCMWAVREVVTSEGVSSEARVLLHPFAPWGEDFVNVLRASPDPAREIAGYMGRRAKECGDPEPPEAVVERGEDGRLRVYVGQVTITSPWDNPEVFGAVVEGGDAPSPESEPVDGAPW